MQERANRRYLIPHKSSVVHFFTWIRFCRQIVLRPETKQRGACSPVSTQMPVFCCCFGFGGGRTGLCTNT